MKEQSASVITYEPTGKSMFFAKSRQPNDEPSYQGTVPVGRMLSNQDPEISNFGIMALWHHEGEVVAVLEKRDGNLFCRQEGEEEAIKVKKGQQKLIPIGSSGLRVVDLQSRRQLLIRLNETLPIGVPPVRPEPTLLASVALAESASPKQNPKLSML